MAYGFPVSKLHWVLCNEDAGKLEVVSPTDARPGDRVRDGAVRCVSCGRDYPIEGGILRMLDSIATMDADSAHEAKQRDQYAEDFERSFVQQMPAHHSVEMGPTLGAMRLYRGGAVLELGCGTGRLTTAIAAGGADVLAVDFSLSSLQLLASKLSASAPVALLHADLTRLHLKQRAFDRALATCVSNLPTPEHRRAMYRLAAGALHARGRFVFSTYFYNRRRRRAGESQEGRYDGGVYFYLFRPEELERETAPYFTGFRAQPIVPSLRLGKILPRWAGGVYTLAASVAFRMPVLNDFGWLLLTQVSNPVQVPGDEHHTAPMRGPTLQAGNVA